MTRAEFQKSAERVKLYGNLLMALTGTTVIALACLAIWWTGPSISALGDFLRGQFPDEGIAGLIGGLLGGIALAPLLLLMLVPTWWLDRQIGLRCPNCNRSITLRCHHSTVLETGICCRCKQPLFESTQDPVDVNETK